MEECIDFIKKEYRFITAVFLVLLIIGIGWYEWRSYRPIPMQTVQQLNYAELAKAMQLMGIDKPQKEMHYITEKVIEASKGTPQQTFTTNHKQEADSEAAKIAARDKAQFIFKNTLADHGKITNNYFGVHTELNNKLSAEIIVTKDSGIYEKFEYAYKRNAFGILIKGEKLLGSNKIDALQGISYRRVLWEK